MREHLPIVAMLRLGRTNAAQPKRDKRQPSRPVSLISETDARQFSFFVKEGSQFSFFVKEGGGRRRVLVDAQDFRALAQRCRDLLLIAIRPEVKEQLRLWAEDFDEAEAMEVAGVLAADAKIAEG
jgi:hypothetical protein